MRTFRANIGGISLIFDRFISMKHPPRQIGHLVIGIAVLFLLGSCFPVDAQDPTLARLSCWIPPERMEEFGTAYAEQIAPVLKKHGLETSPERGRTTVDSVFSRLFQIEIPADVAEKQKTLDADSRWEAVLQYLGATFGDTTSPDGWIRYRFDLYSAPADSGKTVAVGPGRKVSAGPGRGHWRTYDAADGLAGIDVRSMIQDRDGYLWFAAEGSGVSRYDGKEFTTFTTQDGLVNNQVVSMLQDREGHFWFGTWGGVSRYDGRSWTTFTTADGLGSGWVAAILQDTEGDLWFGTFSGGVSRYDGERFTTFTTDDGLAHNQIFSILQAREAAG